MIKSIIRISILVALSLVAYIGIVSEPLDDSTSWLADFFFSKGIGFLAAWSIYKLYPRWVETDKWIAAYDKWSVGEVDEDEEDYDSV